MTTYPGEKACSIAFSEEACTLCVTLNGFWTPLVATQFKTDILSAVKALSTTKPVFHTLIDQRAFGVQSPDTVRTLNETFARTGPMHSGRVAVATPSILAKLQVERNNTDPRLRVFGDLGSAQAWLEAD